MTDVHKEESQKTVISFIFGLLIGGLLVWAFMGGNGTEADKKESTETVTASSSATLTASSSDDSSATATTPTLTVGTEGKVTITDKAAGRTVKVSDVTYPIEEGWIGVRTYSDGKLGWILGVVRFSKAGNVVPENIYLQTPTVAGQEYAIVMFTEAGDRAFNSATDRQLDTIFTTFKAE